ncbi:anti-sigma factor family protein [Arenibaculum pallidiluteum]|uniref:anti-sigma factor family protein n=1 Tax=Arenibaculum pallidiluteum TaxID=2812559 RepID=UPI001A977C6C|nr:anti-sigma factor [Arenibaculum pallidiluteum]
MNAVNEAELQAYVDGRLSPKEAARVEALLAVDDDARAEVSGQMADRTLLREAASAMDPGPAPAETDALVTELARRLVHRRAARRPAVLARAAAVLLVMGAGWMAHLAYEQASDPLPSFVTEAAGAHEVFAELKDHAVEMEGGRRAEMAAWFSDRLGEPVPVPTLDAIGIDLVGGRLLGTREGPLAHLVYEDRTGHRMTLSIWPHSYEGNTAPVVVEHHGVKLGYWSDQSLSYVLAARTTDLQIQSIAAEIAAPWRRIEKASLPQP